MALSSTSGAGSRPLALLVAVGFVTMASLLAVPARGAFGDLSVAPGQYTGTNLYVPTETMQITLTADPGDVYDVQVTYWAPPFTPASRIVRQTFNDVTIPSSAVRTLAYPIPADMPDGDWYWVSVHDGQWYENNNAGNTFATYRFRVQMYTFDVRMGARAYLPGDTFRVFWSATLIKDGSPAPPGSGELQAYDWQDVSLLSPVRYTFNASQGSAEFPISALEAPGHRARVYAWFNDTAGLRHGFDLTFFDINYLGVLANVERTTYAPGAIVTVDISTKVTDQPGNPSPFDPGSPGALVNVTVVDLGTGSAVLAYGRSGLTTDAHGDLTYVFQLASTPTSAQYEVQVHAVARSTSLMTADDTDTFTVQSTTAFSVEVILDKGQYLSGETVRATALVFRTPPGTYVYTWTVEDAATGNLLYQAAGPESQLNYTTAADFEGNLRIRVAANDGEGNTASDTATAQVAFGYLALSLSPAEYSAGDTITATFSLLHGANVLTNPMYYYEVRNAGGAIVASGSVTGNSAQYTTPVPASSSYTFLITASQDGRTVTGSATAVQVSGYLLILSLDKPAYLPGETIRIRYEIQARGTSVLPREFHFTVTLLGVATTTVTTTSPAGELSLVLPGGTFQGDLLLGVSETSTGTTQFQTVHIGPTNPLLTEVGGLPVFDWLLLLVLLVLILAVLLLWRRTTAGAPPRPAAARPTPPPPPPVAAPAPTGPMTVACRSCGKPIEITTSKRPIEVMCPSCGETQLVQ